MAFLKVGGEPPKKKQRLYIMEIVLPSGMTVIKCGKASGPSSKERMLQICSSIYDKHRRTPMIKIQRDREVDADLVFKYETIIHKFFSDYQFSSKAKWDGVTECFVVPLDDMIAAYEAVIDGLEPEHIYSLPVPELDKYGIPF